MVSRKNLTISAVVLTKNEEGNIEDCLKSLSWCDETIVVDDHSSDKTRELAQNLGAKVFINPLDDDFSAQRNYGLEKAGEEWVLFVDADERISSFLREEIKTQISNEPAGFFLRRKDFIFGRWLNHGETASVKLLRLAKKGAGKWVRPVHEVWQVEGRLEELKNPLLHYPHQTIKEFLEEINFYTTLNARVFYKQGIKASFWQVLVYPLAKFKKNYWLNLGFLDGIEGLLLAIFMSFHSFLTRAKLFFYEET